MPHKQNSPLQQAQIAFGENLKELLRRQELSQAGLGRALSRGNGGVSTKTINNIVEARHPPELGNLSTIAEFFGVPLWVMFIPGLPKEMLERSSLERLRKLMDDYLACGDNERRFTENMAAGYAGLKKQK